MRKAALLAGVALCCVAHPVRAQLVTISPSADALSTISLGHQVTELARWSTQASQMIQQINYLTITYQALAHATNYGTIVGALQTLGVRNPLPVSPYAVQGLLNGTGGAGGMLGTIGALLGGARTANTVYTPTSGTWVANEVARNGGSLAGAQALALQLYQSAATRLNGLTELQAQINATTDPSMRETLIARLNTEQAYVETANTQAAALGNYMEAEYRVEEQRASEKLQMDADSFVAQAQADGAW